MFNYQLDSE
ncbi:Protein of unknown function [Bacillus wiedmannii]|nr:Protein of unknown function [Bacillus wiedmannii]